MRKIFIIIGATALLSGCSSIPSLTDSKPSLEESRTLTATEVKQLFVGNTVESHNRNTKLNSFTYYHPNGQAVQQRLWSQRLGRWSIEDSGKICLAFGNSSMKCRHIVKENGKFYKVRPDSSGNPQRIVRYRYFAKGNLLQDDT